MDTGNSNSKILAEGQFKILLFFLRTAMKAQSIVQRTDEMIRKLFVNILSESLLDSLMDLCYTPDVEDKFEEMVRTNLSKNGYTIHTEKPEI